MRELILKLDICLEKDINLNERGEAILDVNLKKILLN